MSRRALDYLSRGDRLSNHRSPNGAPAVKSQPRMPSRQPSRSAAPPVTTDRPKAMERPLSQAPSPATSPEAPREAVSQVEGLAILNLEPTRIPGPQFLHDLVQSTSTGGLPAILSVSSLDAKDATTYEEMHGAADILAARILRALDGDDSERPRIIPVLVPQGANLYISQLAVLKAGGAFCPLNLDAPQERVRFILQDVSARVAIATAEQASGIPQDAVQTIIIVDEHCDDSDLDDFLPGKVEVSATSESLAYVMYTSGSTGTPKGVGVSHSAAVQSLLAHDRHMPAFRRFLQFAAPTFDVSVFEIFFPLSRGCTLVTCERGEMLNDLPAVIRAGDVDACELTPTVAGSLLRSREAAPSLKLLLTIGEMLTEPVIREFGGSDSSASMLWAMYGPTEAAIHCTLQPASRAEDSPRNIGVPLDTVSCFIIDTTYDARRPEEFNVLQVGDVGELVVGGYQLASGYINRPEQTNEVFVTSPYGPVYRTGDKARILPDGRIECLGRISEGQVKLRGQRMELGEVEQAVLRAPGCHSAVAAVSGSVLVAFCAVVANVTENEAKGRISNMCRSWLPAFMVPGDLVILRDFPRLSSGKVDRKRLRADYEAAKTTTSLPPEEVSLGEDGQRVMEAVEELLGRSLQPSASLQGAGIDSLVAIQLSSKLRLMDFHVHTAGILGCETLSALVQLALEMRNAPVSSQQGHASSLETKPPEFLAESHDILQDSMENVEWIGPCTPLQQSLLTETAINSSAYCNQVEIEFFEGADTNQIIEWFRCLSAANDILRTGFIYEDGGFVQVVFKEPLSEIIQVVSVFRDGFVLEDDHGFLTPLLVQVRPGDGTTAPRAMIYLHHAIYDGWSLDILLADLSALIRGEPIADHPSFRDVVKFYSKSITEIELNDSRAFWAEYLLGWQKSAFPKLAARQASTSGVRVLQMKLDFDPVASSARLREYGYSSLVLFQACVAWLLGALQGDSDVVLGSVTSGRTLPLSGIDKIVGPCIAPMPLRVDMSGMECIEDLLRSIHVSNRTMLQHSTLSLGEIKKVVGINPGEPLYDVLFTYQESPFSSLLQKAPVRQVSHVDRLETGLLVEIEPRMDHFNCTMTYHTEMIPQEQAELLLQHLDHLVRHFLESPDGHLESVYAAFDQSLLSIHNTQPSTGTETKDLATAVELVVSKQPDSDALWFSRSLDGAITDEDVISYSQLNRLANKIARHLEKQGATLGDVIAIIMQKSPLLYASILAIVKAGCAYLPLLPSTPLARIDAILDQARIRVCIVDQDAPVEVRTGSSRRVSNLHTADLSVYPDGNLGLPAEPSRLAYVIYTSGTTGVPKGVAVTQHNITSNIEVLSRIYPLRVGGRLLQACSQAFDVSVFEIFFTWLNGMCLCSGTNDTILGDLEKTIRMMGVTHLSMTPTVAALVNPRNVLQVEFLVTAGEPMTPSVQQRWGSTLYQGYGPSETTNICTVKKMDRADYPEHLGWGLENTSTVILVPDSFEIVPRSCVGELCFGGDQVAAGYLHMEDLTAAAFVNHPRYGRLYRTGDLGRMLSDGSLLILGRLDGQIKLRGQRIEVLEIASTIASSGLATSNTSLITTRGGSEPSRLVTFYVPLSQNSTHLTLLPFDAAAEVTNAKLAQLLASRLPSYMVPSYLIPISTIPQTQSGKLDKSRLETMFRSLDQDGLNAASTSTYEEESKGDWTNEENRIADMISDTLDVPREILGRWTPLTAVGLDSISAIRVAKSLRRLLGHSVLVSDILRSSSITQLARLSTAKSAPQDIAPVPLLPKDLIDTVKHQFDGDGTLVEEILPCTPLQQAMLASRQGGSYYNQTTLRLNVPVQDMKRYWEAMMRRHSVLRTCFMTTSDSQNPFVQVILQNWQVQWHSHEDSRMFSRDPQATMKRLRLPQDIASSKTPPVWLLSFKDGDATRLSFLCHHALYDGVAMETLLLEVEQMAKKHELPPVVSYRSFFHELVREPDDTTSFWSAHFRGFNTHRILATDEAVGGHVSSSLNAGLQVIEGRLRAMGISLLSMMQAAWVTTLSAILGQPDICFGLVMSGRTADIDGIDRLVAPCFNTIAVRCNVGRFKQKVAVLRYFQQLNPLLLQHQFTPLRRIQGLVAKDGRHIFDTLLLLQQPARHLDDSVWLLEDDVGSMDLPLVCEILPIPRADSVQVMIHYDGAKFSSETGSNVLKLFSKVFDSYLSHPSSQPDLPNGFLSSVGMETLQLESRDDDLAHGQADCPDEDQEWTEAELSVRSVLANISRTNVKRIRHHTSLFQLGLDSINAVQVASSLRKQGIKVTAVDVIEGLTCHGIAQKAERDGDDGPREFNITAFQEKMVSLFNYQPSAIEGVETILPCTQVQCAMLSEFVKSNGQHYFNYSRLRFSFADTDVATTAESLIGALGKVVCRHAMLRTGFVETDFPEAPFAMVQYSDRPREDHVSFIHSQPSAGFDGAKWRLECSQRALQDLAIPPWAAAIVQTGDTAVLHLCLLHALYDAQSLDSILGDLESFISEPEQPLAEPASLIRCVSTILGLSDFCENRSSQFWEHYAGSAVPNKFPIMTPLREPKGKLCVASRDSSIAFAALESKTKAAEISVQAIIQAAWARVLATYLGEPSVMFGVVLSGRTTDETREAVFPCINTVPVVADADRSNWTLLSAMMEYNSGLYRHQFARPPRIHAWLGQPQGQLFDTVLVYQRLQNANHSNRAWELEDEDASVGYPVSLEVEPLHGDRIRLRLSFLPEVLPKEQADIILQQFDSIFVHLACDPHGYEDDLLQHHKSLFSIMPAPVPMLPIAETLLHQFVETGAENRPEKVALQFVSGFCGDQPNSRDWTYGELNRAGNRVANLVASHASPGSIVAIHFSKCPEAYFAILGILKAGCGFLALDISAPQSRKEFILNDCEAAALLTEEEDALDFSIHCPVVEIREESTHNLPDTFSSSRSVNPSDTCYCLYTSGTTGTPKGCKISHENAVQAMASFQILFDGHWKPDSKWLQFASFHFDVSVLEQYWSWSVGIAVVAAPRDLILDDLASTLRRLHITHIDLTPSLARLIEPKDVPSLCDGVFITGGEQLRQEILDAWGPTNVIYNAYGPTEATIGVTMFQRVPVNGRASNIGRQFPNVGTFVLKPQTETPVLRGGVGELCVSGKLVGLGYLKRLDLTSERFPTLKDFKERVYRTGDLVRVLHDGCFEFLGRADDQVKLRGQRLEIGEINHAIRAVPDIADVATIVAKHKVGDRDMLLSFVVCREDEDRGTPLRVQTGENPQRVCQVVQDSCRSKLPGYMIPTYVFQIPRIPLSANSKADTKELKRLFNDISQDELLRLRAAPSRGSTQVSVELRHALQDFADCQTLEIVESTSIYDVGVDSISVLRLVRALKKHGVYAATPTLILHHPIIGDLSAALRATAGTRKSTEDAVALTRQTIRACDHTSRSFVCRELGIARQDIEYIAPSTPLQEGMISRFMTDPQSGVYFNSMLFEIDEGVCMRKLRHAWNTAFAMHSILRTQFVATPVGYVQAATQSSALPWQEAFLDGSNSVESELAVFRARWLAENETHIKTPFRILLVKCGPRHILIANIFHGLYDAVSLDILLDHVSSLYEGREIVQGPAFIDMLAVGPLRKVDTAHEFWRQHLNGWNPRWISDLSDMPGDEDTVVKRTVDLQVFLRVQKRLNVTLQAVVLSAWSRTLQSQAFTAPNSIGVIFSGRSLEVRNIEHVVGPLFNTLPFYLGAAQAQSYASIVRRCHDFCSLALPYQHTPLRDIQKWCSGGMPLFDNIFSFQLESRDPTSTTFPWTSLDAQARLDYYALAFDSVATTDGNLLVTVATKNDAGYDKINGLLDSFEAFVSQLFANMDSELKLPIDGAAGLGQGDIDHSVNGSAKVISKQTDDLNSSDFEWTETADALRTEISQIAGVSSESVRETTSLFELGLDSIDIVKLSARLKQRNVHITASQLMRGRTINGAIAIAGSQAPRQERTGSEAALARQVRKLHEWRSSTTTNIDDCEIDSLWPPTPIQESMVAEMLQSSFRNYYNHDVLKLGPDIEIPMLTKAVNTLVENSPILRTRFLPIDSPELPLSFCQEVIRHRPITIDVKTLDKLDDIDKILQEAQERAVRGGGLKDLFQLTVAIVDGQKYLALSIAHALYDGWSLALLHKDLLDAYKGSYKRRPDLKATLEAKVETVSSESRDFWSQYLGGATQTLVPKPASVSAHGGHVHRAERPSETPSSVVSAFTKRFGISLQVIGQTCWAAVLATMTRSLDVTFGVVLSGRDSEEAEEVMFPTMNTVVVRSILHGTSSSLLQYMQDNMANVFEHQNLSLREAHRLAGAGAGGLFNTLFILQRAPRSAVSNDSSWMVSIRSQSDVQYPLCVELEVTEDGLLWRTACDAEHGDENIALRILDQLDDVLRFLIESPTSDILRLEQSGTSVCRLPGFQHQLMTARSLLESDLDDNGSSIIVECDQEEAILMAILSQISGIEETSISKSQSLYHLGLDSISAIKVAAKLRDHHVRLSVRDLVSARSIAEMARISRTNSNTASSQQVEADSDWKPPSWLDVAHLCDMAAIKSDLVEEVLPATPMQVHMLSAWQNARGRAFYSEFHYRLPLTVHISHVRRSWEAVVSKLDILRTSFVATGHPDIPFLQLISTPNSNHAASTENSRDTPAQPLAHLSCRKADDASGLRLTIHIHHALYDGVSLPKIVKHLSRALGGIDETEPNYRHDWRRFTTALSSNNAIKSREAFWKSYLDMDAQTTGFNTVDSRWSSGDRISYLAKGAVRDVQRVKLACSGLGISLQALLFAAYARFLAKARPKSGKETTVVFGIYHANRAMLEGLGHAPYPTLSLLPLCVRVEQDSAIVDTATRIQQDLHAITVYPNCTVGLWEIWQWTGHRIDSFINFLGTPESDPDNFLIPVRTESAPGNSHFKIQPLDDCRWLSRNSVAEAFPEPIDIEVAMSSEGMDIGVFGSEEKLGGLEPSALISGVIRELDRISA